MVIAVDLLVLGGGVQGLALMKELSGDYSAVLVGRSLRASETLQFHGHFSSGWNAANLEAAKVFCQAASSWRSDLKEYNLPFQQNPFYVALPEKTAASLEPNWEKAGIAFRKAPFPKPFDLSRLPAHEAYHFPEDLVCDGAPVIAQLQQRLAGALLEGEVTGVKIHDGVVQEVAVRTGKETVTVTPGFVLAACGAGNAALLQLMGLPREQVARSQVARPLHMVLARGTALPAFSGYFSDLAVIGHPLDDGEKLWLITYNPPTPKFTEGAVEMARDPQVEPAVVRTSLEKLATVLPDLGKVASQCRWDVYVGWKTDAPGGNPDALLRLEYAKPYDVRSFGVKNFLAVWPNRWHLATPAAKDAGKVVRDTLKHGVAGPRLPANPAPDPDAARMKWVRSDRRWQSWAEFAKTYNFSG